MVAAPPWAAERGPIARIVVLPAPAPAPAAGSTPDPQPAAGGAGSSEDHEPARRSARQMAASSAASAATAAAAKDSELEHDADAGADVPLHILPREEWLPAVAWALTHAREGGVIRDARRLEARVRATLGAIFVGRMHLALPAALLQAASAAVLRHALPPLPPMEHPSRAPIPRVSLPQLHAPPREGDRRLSRDQFATEDAMDALLPTLPADRAFRVVITGPPPAASLFLQRIHMHTFSESVARSVHKGRTGDSIFTFRCSRASTGKRRVVLNPIMGTPHGHCELPGTYRRPVERPGGVLTLPLHGFHVYPSVSGADDEPLEGSAWTSSAQDVGCDYYLSVCTFAEHPQEVVVVFPCGLHGHTGHVGEFGDGRVGVDPLRRLFPDVPLGNQFLSLHPDVRRYVDSFLPMDLSATLLQELTNRFQQQLLPLFYRDPCTHVTGHPFVVSTADVMPEDYDPSGRSPAAAPPAPGGHSAPGGAAAASAAAAVVEGVVAETDIRMDDAPLTAPPVPPLRAALAAVGIAFRFSAYRWTMSSKTASQMQQNHNRQRREGDNLWSDFTLAAPRFASAGWLRLTTYVPPPPRRAAAPTPIHHTHPPHPLDPRRPRAVPAPMTWCRRQGWHGPRGVTCTFSCSRLRSAVGRPCSWARCAPCSMPPTRLPGCPCPCTRCPPWMS